MSLETARDAHSAIGRIRLAELTSGLGAAVLGLGLGVVMASYLSNLGVPILVAGLLLHAWGMTDKHRLEANPDVPSAWWVTALYWGCWLLLGALAGFLVLSKLFQE
jgi:hypothetical protein